ncbi:MULTISPECIES: hypothetical protein [unclassified Streptomyces]|uniref:hypothetical protein n=1 Tax=unclassified Streptomyces TaxID=2593676 RepID=UPI00225A01EC|nr:MULTISPECIES: hypothetical protein [unclassified Streptomyces]MCX5329997.1 hypothetical protein [Streptomyces sp. NBC_00140]MCX5359413.1 hypothetical protein [Streptomyces sp. NBC_00124]
MIGALPAAGFVLDVDRRATWAYPYRDFPLLEIRDGRPVRVRTSPVRYAHGVLVHGEHVAFFGDTRLCVQEQPATEWTLFDLSRQ